MYNIIVLAPPHQRHASILNFDPGPCACLSRTYKMAESGAQVMRHTIYTVLVFVLLTYLLFHVALYSQLFSRLGAKELLGDLGLPLFSQLTPVTHSDAVLRPGDVIEFCGAEGTAKSELLLNIAVRCVLPKTWKGKRLGGKETEVVFISTDFKFDLFRLSQILEGHLHEALETQPLDQTTPQASPSKDEYKEVISLSLARVHVLYCNSSTELTVTLQSLKTFFHNHPGVCVLMVDNVAAYYWTDRARTASRLEECQLQWIKLLSQLRLDYHLVVFAAKPLLLQRQENVSKQTRNYTYSKALLNNMMSTVC